jgi:hypothetical protein
MELGPEPQVLKEGTQLAERVRVQLRTFPTQLERPGPGPQVCPLLGNLRETVVGEQQHDTGAAKEPQALQHRECAAHERMERVGDDHRISGRRWR